MLVVVSCKDFSPIPIRSQYFLMQYAYSWDRLLRHDIAPWTLTLMLMHQSRGLWVKIARKACWLACCKMRLDAVGHPGIFGILHLTYCVLGHTKSSSALLNSMVVWILECSLPVCWWLFQVKTSCVLTVQTHSSKSFHAESMVHSINPPYWAAKESFISFRLL